MLRVWVAYAGVDQQAVLSLSIDEALTIKEVILRSAVFESVAELNDRRDDLDDFCVGIYGKLKTLNDYVSDGDRVEIYRPLKCDPKLGRRQRVELERAERKAQKRFDSY